MLKREKPKKSQVRPPARRAPDRKIHQPCIDAVKFDIEMDEGSAVRGRLDPDGTAVVTASDGRGGEVTAWTTDPRVLRDLIVRLTDIATCMDWNIAPELSSFDDAMSRTGMGVRS